MVKNFIKKEKKRKEIIKFLFSKSYFRPFFLYLCYFFFNNETTKLIKKN